MNVPYGVAAEAALDFTGFVAQKRRRVIAADALTRKVDEQVFVSGEYQAARNLRKQGYGLDVALALIAGRV
jgi:hypothetical protein